MHAHALSIPTVCDAASAVRSVVLIVVFALSPIVMSSLYPDDAGVSGDLVDCLGLPPEKSPSEDLFADAVGEDSGIRVRRSSRLAGKWPT